MKGVKHLSLLDPPLAENIFFKTPFWAPLQNGGPDLKACGERSWLPISKMVRHFTISSVVWLLELCEVARKILEKIEPPFFLTPPLPPPPSPLPLAE